MAKTKPNKIERYQEYTLRFSVGMAILYAAYWAALSITNTKQTGDVHIVNDVLLVALVISGVIMGIMYSVHSSKEK